MNTISLIIFFAFVCQQVFPQSATPGKPLPPWEKGFLDLHHINTGRGSAAFYIFPEGTTMLFDAGEIPPTDPRVNTARNAPLKPDSSKKPYEWIVWYIKKNGPAKEQTVIDYALSSHFHDDHFGSAYPGAPQSANGDFLLSGITGVGELIPFLSITDRAAPDYNYPFDFRKEKKDRIVETNFDGSFKNYLNFLKHKQSTGMELLRFRPGSSTQFVQKNPADAKPGFFVRNVKSNGKIWTGRDSAVVDHFAATSISDPASWPDENSLSIAITINYGPFTYYTGGDNPGNPITGDSPLRDVETPIAKAVGEVDVATMDHHGNRDAVNELMVGALRPRVWIGQTWSSDHPGHEVLMRITNKKIYDQPRDIFATNMLEANKIVIGPLIDKSYRSQQGHIVVRVLPGGASYYVIILDDESPEMPVKSVFGPYVSKSKNSFITSN